MLALADLAGYEGARVAVGGLITALDGTRLTIDDGSATAVLRLAGDAARLPELMALGDLVNATGLVERTAANGLEVVVDDPTAIEWIAPLSAPNRDAPVASGTALPTASEPDQGLTAGTSGPVALVAAVVAIVALLAFAAALAMTPAYRRRLNEWLLRTSITLKRRLAQLRSG